MKSRSVWTPREEAQLQELLERKDRIVTENRKAVASLVTESWGDDFNGSQAQTIIDWLIENSGEVRDALEPFDLVPRSAPDK